MRRLFFVLLGSTALTACSEQQSIQLHSGNGRLTLDYTCTDSVPRPLNGTPLDLMRGSVTQETAEHVLAAPVSEASRGHVEAVRRAHAAGDLLRLEQAVVSYVCAYGRPPNRPPRFPEAGSVPPEIVLNRLNEQGEIVASPVRLPGGRGRPMVVSFWATWCVPCRKEYRELQALAARAEAEGFDLFVVLHRDTREQLLRWKAEHGGGVPFYWDEGGKAARNFQILGVPHNYVVGSDGRMRAAAPGGGAGRLNQFVQEALAAR